MKQVDREKRSDLYDLASFYRSFCKKEDGVVTIFACFMIFMMVMVGGIGVDLMRHEMERTRIQAVADRAVLAAADLDQTLGAEAVVLDYFAKSGIADVVSEVTLDQGANFRTVTVDASININTQFMDFMGVDTLLVPAVSQASERVPNVEISLALDITTSMDQGTRIADLKPAAVAFIDTVLADDSSTITSVSLIPYGGQVNPGPAMFNYVGAQRIAPTPLDEVEGGIPEHESHGTLPQLDANGDPIRGGVGIDPIDTTRYVWPNQSSCPEIQVTGFNSASLPAYAAYAQTPYFSIWNHNKSAVKDVGWCPDDESQIQYMSNDRTQINNTINGMRLYDGTGTQYAMQWALALLDPSSANDLTSLANALNIPNEFSGRPASYSDQETRKYIILMTDGGISDQFRPNEIFGQDNAIKRLNKGRKNLRYLDAGRSVGFARFSELCALAKTRGPIPIIVYTIAFETPAGPQEDAMRNCASSPSHFFNADGGDIADTFQSIARQINQLKLTQ